MPTVMNSDQYALRVKSIPSYVSVNAWGGRVRRAYFTITLPASGNAIGDSILLAILPQKARILGGQFVWDTAQGITATTAIGDGGSTGRYFAAAVTNSLAINRIADTVAQNTGYEITSDTPKTTNDGILQALNAAAAWAASSKLFGWIDYMVD